MARKTNHEELKQKITALEKRIAEYKGMERVLREREEEYLNLFHSIPDPVVIVQTDKNAISNNAFSKLFGYVHPDPSKESTPFESIAENDASDQLKTGAGEIKTIPGLDDVDLEEKKMRTVPCEASSTLIKYKGEPANLVIFRNITDSKEAQEELTEREKRLSLALDISQDGLWDWDLDSKSFYTSPRLREVIGAEEDLNPANVNDWMFSHIHPEHYDHVMRLIKEHVEKKIPLDVEYLYRPGTGKEYRWHHMYGKALFDKNGKIYRMAGYLRDITDRKQADEALRESERRYRLLAESVTDVIYTMDMDLKFTYLSPSITKLIGYSVDEALRLTCKDIFTQDSLEVARKTYKEALANLHDAEKTDFDRSYVLELELKHKDGSTVWIENHIKFLRDSNHQATGATGIIRNISARKQIENELRNSEERLRLAYKATEEGIWEWNIPENRVFFSPRAKELFGYKETDQIEDSFDYWQSLIHPDQRAQMKDLLEQFLERTTPFNVDFLYLFKNGEYRWLNSRSIVLRDNQGKPYRAVGSVRDIHREKQAEELIRKLTHSLINSQENERRKISTELRDSVALNLSASKSVCEKLLEYKSLTPGVREQVSKISANLQETTILVRNLSYNLRPPGLEKLGLIRTVDQYCRDFSKENRIDVEFRSTGIDDLELDYETKINLYRIAQERLSNIKKYSDAKNVRVKMISSFPNIILLIENDGAGFDMNKEMSPASRDKWIGIQNLQERVSLLKGEMEVDSSSEKGTKILIKIPIQ